jgi:hypothetical protein
MADWYNSPGGRNERLQRGAACDTRDCNFVLRDSLGHQIDVHSYAFDSAGNYVYGVEYPAESLTGTGSVNGHPVRCISPEWMVKFHTGSATIAVFINFLLGLKYILR